MAGKVRVSSYAISLDGFGAGPDQSLEAPLGVGGERLHQWFFPTKTFQGMYGDGQGETGVDNDFAERGMAGIGAWILGRNMFGPIRGTWDTPEGRDWQGWWGDEPPYHCAVFVLTHHERAPLEMAGGTTFHFVTDGIESALEQAFAAADGADVRVGGGASTVRQYLRAGLLDELHVPMSPVLLGRGERLFDDDLEDAMARYEVADVVPGEGATHLMLRRRSVGGARQS
jgi:dihydrofolate reductase